MKKFKKSYQIAKFIEANNPSRKEIVTHLMVNINKKYSSIEEFDYKNHYGHYSTNFCQWKHLGNVTTKKGRYTLTQQCIDNDYKLYSKPTEAKLKDAKKSASFWKREFNNINNLNWELAREIDRLKKELKNATAQAPSWNLTNELTLVTEERNQLKKSNAHLSERCRVLRERTDKIQGIDVQAVEVKKINTTDDKNQDINININIKLS